MLTLHSDLDMVHQDIEPAEAESGSDSGGSFFGKLFSGWGKSEKADLPAKAVPESDTLPPPLEK